MKRFVEAFACVFLFPLFSAAQSTPPKPAFASATVHNSDPANQRKTPLIVVNASCASCASYISISLKQLIMAAYGVTANQVSGPAWLDSHLYDVVATLPAGASVNDAPQMLQTLLKDRFKLAFHVESKNQQVMALVVAKGGPKLLPARASLPSTDKNAALNPGESERDTPDGPIRVTKGNHGSVRYPTAIVQSNRMTMEQFADLLTRLMPRGGEPTTWGGGPDLWSGGGNGLDSSEYEGDWKLIVDQTGLKGEYQVSVEYSPFAPGLDPFIFSSVQQLGLKLQLSTRKVVKSLVVDHAEKNPTAN
jgi:uncharacterized protein (TIGR03435 family)